ncbi:MAG: hypothetical protein LLG06_16310 [Desulfobacteraceae bacterium]|nr:hypothetical protein [Desulfobacteraceae bacterium]
MRKITIEFINTCPCCDAFDAIIRSETAQHPGIIDYKLYQTGRDFDYLKKYGPITKGTMIIDGKKKYDTLSRSIIEKAIADAVKESGR